MFKINKIDDSLVNIKLIFFKTRTKMMNDSSLFLDNPTCPVSGYMIYPDDDMTCPIDGYQHNTHILYNIMSTIGPAVFQFGVFMTLLIGVAAYFFVVTCVFMALSYGFVVLLSSLFYTCLACFRANQECIDDDFMDDAMSSLTQKHFPKDRAD